MRVDYNVPIFLLLKRPEEVLSKTTKNIQTSDIKINMTLNHRSIHVTLQISSVKKHVCTQKTDCSRFTVLYFDKFKVDVKGVETVDMFFFNQIHYICFLECG